MKPFVSKVMGYLTRHYPVKIRRLQRLRITQVEQLLVREEVDIVCTIDGLWNTIDLVRDWQAGVSTLRCDHIKRLIPGEPRRN